MTQRDKNRINELLQQLAQRDGVSVEAVRQDIQESIDEAWACQDPGVRWNQLMMFPAGKPTVEEFIYRVAVEMKRPS